jgi:hypothetical protein
MHKLGCELRIGFHQIDLFGLLGSQIINGYYQVVPLHQ